MKLVITGTPLRANVAKESAKPLLASSGVDAVFAIDFIDAAISELTVLRAQIDWRGPRQ